MNKFLLVLGIVIIAVGVISLLFAALQCYGYYNLLDGDADLYAKLRQRMIAFFVGGIVLSAIGALSVILRK